MPHAAAAGPDRASSSPPAAKAEHKQWLKILARYCDPDPMRSLFELAITAVPFFALVGADAVLPRPRLLARACCSRCRPRGFLVRLFMIQHDCGHGSFFRRRRPTTGSAARSAC